MEELSDMTADATEELPTDAPGRPPNLSPAELYATSRLAFDHPAASPEAMTLVAELAGSIEGLERDRSKRQRARGERRRRAFEDAVGYLLGGLALSVDKGGTPPVGCPKAAGAFTALPVGYRTFMDAYRGFVALGLLVVVSRGSLQRIPEFGPRAGFGRVERIRATEALVALLQEHGITRGTLEQHFPRRGRPTSLVLRSPSGRWYGRKTPGQSLPIPEGEDTQRLKAEVDELNDFIAGVRVEGAELDGWTRIFAEDPGGGRWCRGGRLYARPGEHSYQALPKVRRAAMRLDGEEVVELDIRSSHLALAYMLRGQSLSSDLGHRGEDDAYVIGGLPRDVVKLFVTVALGAGKAPTKWPRGKTAELLDEELPQERRVDLRRHKVREVGEAILRRHPVLGDLEGIEWGRLQFLESEAVVRAMLRLKREFGIPALPVHDSLIVPRGAWWVARDVLWLALRGIGCEPVGIVPSVSEGSLPRPEATRYAEARKRLQSELAEF